MFGTKTFIPDETGEIGQVVDSSREALFQNGNNLPPGDYGLVFVKMFLTLIALAALFGITIWFVKRLIRARLEKGSGTRIIEVIEKKMISPKTILYIVEIEGKRVLLAESQLEVRPILDFKEMDS